MTIGTIRQPFAALHARRGLAGMLVTALVIAAPTYGLADDGSVAQSGTRPRYCTATARAAFRACGHEIQDDFLIASAKCINVSELAERRECFADARASYAESRELCKEQLEARLDTCELVGEGRYDPDFDPASFNIDFANLANSNPYFPLAIGNRWEFRGADEVTTVEILNQTKLIEGVRCIVVRDQVRKDGFLIEDTDDWFAQAKDGSVWYCGEEVKDFETFAGDLPQRPELVSIDGSFKAGREGDKPGIIFLASPARGAAYLEEFSLGNAEDAALVLSTTYAFGQNPELDKFVPQPLVQLLCAGDCVVTKNFSPLEPEVIERKYYAPGIGFFLEVNPDEGEVVQLVSCNFDPRCALLPPANSSSAVRRE